LVQPIDGVTELRGRTVIVCQRQRGLKIQTRGEQAPDNDIVEAQGTRPALFGQGYNGSNRAAGTLLTYVPASRGTTAGRLYPGPRSRQRH
jgi:hypothetical protein